MSIKVKCPGCGKRYKVDDRFGGKKAKCQSCGAAMAVPDAAPAPQAKSDDPFAAMDELEQKGTAAPEPAFAAASSPRPQAAAPSSRRAGTVYNPALAQTTSVETSRSSGASQTVKLGLSITVGLVCFVLAFWGVHLLTGGSPHRTSVTQGGGPAGGSSNSGAAADEHALEATGAADIAQDMSGRRSTPARSPQVPANSAQSAVIAAAPPPADVDVEVKPPVVFKPFDPADAKLLDQLGDEQWLPSAPYVMKIPKEYGGQGSIVFQENNASLKGYQTAYVNIANPSKQTPTSPLFTVMSQHRQNKKFPRVYTQATSGTKWGLGRDDGLDKQLVFDGEKVEFGTLDGVESVRAVGKDDAGRDSVTYALLDNDWFIRIDLINVTPRSPEFQLLDAMVRTLHYKKPTR